MWEHPSTLAKLVGLVDLDASPMRVLDAGCGDARLSRELVRLGHDVSGLDASAVAVSAARAAGIAAEVGDLEARWPFPDSSFDRVLLLDVLEHLADPAAALVEAKRVLASGGQAAVVFPNHWDLRQRLEMLLGRGIVHWSHRRYSDASAARYAHLRFLRLSELERLAREAGFEVAGRRFNYMGGGILPRRLLPAPLRRALASRLPDLLSGKFGLLLSAGPVPGAPKTLALPDTPEGL